MCILSSAAGGGEYVEQRCRHCVQFVAAKAVHTFNLLMLHYHYSTAISDIPKGCVLFGLLIARLFIFSDRLLNILLAMYLVSNKVASN